MISPSVAYTRTASRIEGMRLVSVSRAAASAGIERISGRPWSPSV
jgi:hypothetical protein